MSLKDKVKRATYYKTRYLRKKTEIQDYQKRYNFSHKEQSRTYHREYHKRIRMEAISYYSNHTMCCFCCGENRIEFLSIDHIAGGGSKHRAHIGRSNLAHWLKARDYPTGYRVLCHNCNLSLGFYGYCPHTKESTK